MDEKRINEMSRELKSLKSENFYLKLQVEKLRKKTEMQKQELRELKKN